MKHYEKIKRIRKSLNLSMPDVYKQASAFLGQQKTVSLSTMSRIEEGKPVKLSSIVKYCSLLGITLKDLFKDTEFEERLVIRRKERAGGYGFNQGHSYIVNNPNQLFLAQEFTLEPSAKTPSDYALANKGKSEKWVYVVRGQLTCVILAEKFVLKGQDTISFDSTKPHYFENNSKKKCLFIVVENPGRY